MFEQLIIHTHMLRYLITLKTKSILTECYSLNKGITVKQIKKSGMTILKEHYFSCMEEQILPELLQNTQEQTFLCQWGNSQNDRLLLLDVTIDEQKFVLVNLYNASREKDQQNTISELSEMLKKVNNISAKQIFISTHYQKAKEEILQKKSILLKLSMLKRPLIIAIFGGLEIPKSKDLLFSKIIVLAFLNVDWTFFCFKYFA